MMIKIYGIKNCDSVKKALNWLEENGVKYQFHDYKKEGIDEATLTEFIEKFGLEKVLNSSSRTFRQLSEAQKPNDCKGAILLMVEHNSIIKRPIIMSESINLLGFNINEYQKAFNK